MSEENNKTYLKCELWSMQRGNITEIRYKQDIFSINRQNTNAEAEKEQTNIQTPKTDKTNTDTVKTKICTKCGIEKPLTEYYTDKKNKDGHRSKCKQCIKEENRPSNRTKTCSKCGIEKPLTEYHKSKKGKYGRKSICKECANNYQKDYQHKKTKKVTNTFNKGFSPDEVENMETVGSLSHTPIRLKPLKEIVDYMSDREETSRKSIIQIIMKHIPYKKSSAETAANIYLKWIAKHYGKVEKRMKGLNVYYRFTPKTLLTEKKLKEIVISDGNIPLKKTRSNEERKFWKELLG